MTDMDWAERIEDEIFANAPYESGIPWTGSIATAIRKAKADGYTEAGKVVAKFVQEVRPELRIAGMDIWLEIVRARDKLDPPGTE